jgi:hypothetical protein
MMSIQVDIQIDDLANKIPSLLEKHPEAPKFLRVLAGRANMIVETAALLGDDAKASAEQKVGMLLLRYAPLMRVVSSSPELPQD